MSSGFELHRAPWVVPGEGSPIKDGAVLVRGGEIVAVGGYGTLGSEAPSGTRLIDHESAALIPAPVNAHTHIELSGLRDQISLPKESFSTWVDELFLCRSALTPDRHREAILEAKEELKLSGTALYGDITNGSFLQELGEVGFPLRHAFLELLGFDRENLDAAVGPGLLGDFHKISRSHLSVSLAAHACYSTSAELIHAGKNWCKERNRVFSIHAAEHPEEVEFLRDGTGFCRELLERLGRWVPSWTAPNMSPIEYLDGLGVLASRTLLVHAVHMSSSDWEVVSKRGCSVCFCPRSNYNLGSGTADIGKALSCGVTAALGTDSLASNTDLNLFSEGAFVLDRFPGIRPDSVLSMMTLGGAKALDCDKDFGSITAGKRSAILAIQLPGATTAAGLAESIIHMGREGACKWVS